MRSLQALLCLSTLHFLTGPCFAEDMIEFLGGSKPRGKVPIVYGSDAGVSIPFAAPKDISEASVSGVTSLVAGDINGDGRADVVVIEGGKTRGSRKTFAWFDAPAQNEDNWVRHDFKTDAPLRHFLGAARLADMDGDGNLDLVVSSDMHSGDTAEADVFVFSNPRPRLSAAHPWRAYRVNDVTLSLHHINDMEIADMDGDGKLDVVCRSLLPNQVHIFFQNNLSSFDRKSIDTELEKSEGLAVGQLGDGVLPDITFTGVWLASPGNPRTGPYTRRSIDADYAKVNQNTKEAIGDIDGDGLNDVVIGPAEAFRGGKDHHLAWYSNPGSTNTGDWQRHVINPSTNNNHTVRLGDMDSDGDLDIVTGIPWANKSVRLSVLIYYNNGAGRFSVPQTVAQDKGMYTGVVIDFDGDGDLDLLGQDSYSRESKPWLYENLLRK